MTAAATGNCHLSRVGLQPEAFGHVHPSVRCATASPLLELARSKAPSKPMAQAANSRGLSVASQAPLPSIAPRDDLHLESRGKIRRALLGAVTPDTAHCPARPRVTRLFRPHFPRPDPWQATFPIGTFSPSHRKSSCSPITPRRSPRGRVSPATRPPPALHPLCLGGPHSAPSRGSPPR